MDFNSIIGGEAGQGIQSSGFLLAKTFVRGGYHVFADQDYESRIRGGHSFFRIRVSEKQVRAITEPVNILIAMDKATIDIHWNELAHGGVVIYDGEKLKDVKGDNNKLFSIPLEKLAEEKAGNKIMGSTVALGAVVGLTGYDLDLLDKLLGEFFNDEIAKSNIIAAKAGYDYARSEFKGKIDYRLHTISNTKRMLLNGNEALSIAAIAAGCKFMSAYPMTPASSIMEYFAAKADKYDLVMVHTEDEIAAINMAIGASFTGVRSMTATSGSGFCLMVEGLGMASLTETPIVIIDSQRPGPAVGLPTRTEQGDLLFAIHAHHGEPPRDVLSPSTFEECFWLTIKAFNLADKFQLPVIILTDHYLATCYATVDPFDYTKVTIDRGLLYFERESDPGEYKRHQLTTSGISPRAFPGQGKALVITDSDEHDQTGHLTEDAVIRKEQVQKRQRKMLSLKHDMSEPKVYGPQKAAIVLIGWGSTYGALCEAVDMLLKDGLSVNLLHLSEIWPFPKDEVDDIIRRATTSITVENNTTGQLASLIKAETGREVKGKILKFDGRPFTPAYIFDAVKKEAWGW